MIDCAHYRRALLASPHDPDAELARHREGCSECAEYTARLLRFEGKLERALRVSVPEAAKSAEGVIAGGGVVIPLRPRRSPVVRKWLALAASVLLGLGVAGGLWLAAPHTSLAADVVAHMAGEPEAWTRTEVPVPSPELDAVLRDAHMHLGADAGTVSYAQSCLFRGHHVPHLVVQTGMGPVTVMVLVHESVSKPKAFDEDGYRGVLLPVAGHGSIAVLAKDQSGNLASVENVAARVRTAIEWTG
jgi:hypothetical protein